MKELVVGLYMNEISSKREKTDQHKMTFVQHHFAATQEKRHCFRYTLTPCMQNTRNSMIKLK